MGEDEAGKLRRVGLPEPKVQETIKNKALTGRVCELVDLAGEVRQYSCSNPTSLYTVRGRLSWAGCEVTCCTTPPARPSRRSGPSSPSWSATSPRTRLTPNRGSPPPSISFCR